MLMVITEQEPNTNQSHTEETDLIHLGKSDLFGILLTCIDDPYIESC